MFAADVGADPVGLLAQYGVLGVSTALLVVFARTSYKREVDRADRLEAEVKRLNDAIADKAIPALMAATRSIEVSQQLMQSVQSDAVAARRRGREDRA